jgi:transposase
MKSKRRNYDKDFRISAVKLVLEEGKAVSDVATHLGIHPNILHRWKKEYLNDPLNAFPGKGFLKPLEEENRRLRKALRDAEMERDILKKAVVIFSKKPKRDSNG